MRRLLFALAPGFALGLALGCGAQDPPAAPPDELPAVSARAPSQPTPPEVGRCLELVESRDFAAALSVCDEARRMAGLNAVDFYGFDLELLRTVAEQLGPRPEEVLSAAA